MQKATTKIRLFRNLDDNHAVIIKIAEEPK